MFVLPTIWLIEKVHSTPQLQREFLYLGQLPCKNNITHDLCTYQSYIRNILIDMFIKIYLCIDNDNDDDVEEDDNNSNNSDKILKYMYLIL